MGEIQERIDRDHNNVNNVKDNSQKIELDLETTRKEYELAKGEFGKVEARINRDRERIRKTSEEIELLDMKRTHARQVLESTRREMERHLASHKNRNRDVEQSRENIAKWKARIQELNVESEKARGASGICSGKREKPAGGIGKGQGKGQESAGKYPGEPVGVSGDNPGGREFPGVFLGLLVTDEAKKPDAGADTGLFCAEGGPGI